jgi:hypothetical protein
MRLRHSFRRTALRHIGRLAFTLVGLALIMPLDLAQAHGGGTPQLTNAEAGPYRVSVWTQPDPIRVGELHVTVAVSEPSGQRNAGDLVLDATVRVQVEPVGQDEESLVAFATRENAVNKLFYEADLDLPVEGQWRVVTWVEGPAGAGGVSFDIQASSPSAFNNLGTLRWPLWAGLGLVLIVAGWGVQISRDRKTEAHHA